MKFIINKYNNNNNNSNNNNSNNKLNGVDDDNEHGDYGLIKKAPPSPSPSPSPSTSSTPTPTPTPTPLLEILIPAEKRYSEKGVRGVSVCVYVYGIARRSNGNQQQNERLVSFYFIHYINFSLKSKENLIEIHKRKIKRIRKNHYEKDREEGKEYVYTQG